MKEWNEIRGRRVDMFISRKSSFSASLPLELSKELAAVSLSLAPATFNSIVSYNTGVIGFLKNARWWKPWLRQYAQLRRLKVPSGETVFAPFAAEQNALSLCIFRGEVKIRELPGCYNQFPPKSNLWPLDTVIAHFISWHRNHHEARYDLWHSTQKKVNNQLISFGIDQDIQSCEQL